MSHFNFTIELQQMEEKQYKNERDAWDIFKRMNCEFVTPGVIRYRVRFLRATFGDCLNVWPQEAQDEFQQLQRKLRKLENGNGRNGTNNN